jgi:hypothetical protein
LTVRRALRLRTATLGAARVLEAVMACMVTCWRVCLVTVAARAAPAQSPQSTWRLGENGGRRALRLANLSLI